MIIIAEFSQIYPFKAEYSMTLGEKITKLRKDKKLSQIDIANAIGVSRDAISKYERGDIVPSVENAKKIANTLGVSLDYLVSEEERQEAIDNKMIKRIKELQKLSEADQNNIISVIDAFVRDAKTRVAYS